MDERNAINMRALALAARSPWKAMVKIPTMRCQSCDAPHTESSYQEFAVRFFLTNALTDSEDNVPLSDEMSRPMATEAGIARSLA